jgi:hypothetical protein
MTQRIARPKALVTSCAARQTQNYYVSEHLLSIKAFPVLGNMAMRQAIARNSFAIYIGTTARALKEDDLRSLTARGAQDQRGSRSGRKVYTAQRHHAVLVNPEAVLCLRIALVALALALAPKRAG